MLKSSSVKKKMLNSKVLKPSSVEPVKQWPRGSSIVDVAACFRLVSPLDSQQHQQQEHAKRVPDGHGQSFGSWPWQKVINIPDIQVHKANKYAFNILFTLQQFALLNG